MTAAIVVSGFLIFFPFSPSWSQSLDATGTDGLVVELGVPSGKQVVFSAGDPLAIQFSLKNPSSLPVQILAWRTPFKGITDNIFRIAAGRSNGNSSVGYTGPLIKRGPPLPEDFITLGPGETRQTIVNLADYYAIYQQNDYTIVYSPSLPTVGPVPSSSSATDGQVLRKVAVQSNALSISLIETRTPALKPSPSNVAPPDGLAFDQCSTSQEVDLKKAVPAGTELAEKAAKLLRDTPEEKRATAARFKTWFGSYSGRRYGQALSHFDKIYESFKTKPIVISCSGAECAGNIFAYVFPTQPYKIFVCQSFWNAALNGTDSRAGTLVHEMSHFDIVAGTDDVIYGQDGAKALAVSSPDDAVTNADNHEYFSENTPDLPM